MSRLGDGGTLLCHHTISGSPVTDSARHPLEDRAAAAAAAGFTGIGLTIAEYDHLVATGHRDPDLRAVLDAHGVSVPEIEFLNGWWADGERLEADRASEERLYAIAEVFGARHLNIGASAPVDAAPPLDLIIERFAGVCDRAAEHGLLVGLEYMPFFALSDVGKAWEVVRAADRPNGGLVTDAWHHLHGTDGPETLRQVPADRIVAVQLSDAVPDLSAPLIPQSINNRLWPGDGALDVAGFVAVLEDMGVTAPVGLEVLSTRIRGLPAAQIAEEGAASLERVLSAARALPSAS
ncbi:sugar phosphate isomerase/epimerase [Blastococcus sp. URHD0036]|uniref:sugar phosphate isomerase/epimerase family protein n=1 Tax=Blastococcus sp. URHD0036 TaxID=1380356 RepID=UPI000497517A|nr:sugar phosphate isomerase/epimerase family protein [Blastococcus sp. URHD0036]